MLRGGEIFRAPGAENRRKPGPNLLPRRPVSGRHATRIPTASAKKASGFASASFVESKHHFIKAKNLTAQRVAKRAALYGFQAGKH